MQFILGRAHCMLGCKTPILLMHLGLLCNAVVGLGICLFQVGVSHPVLYVYRQNYAHHDL